PHPDRHFREREGSVHGAGRADSRGLDEDVRPGDRIPTRIEHMARHAARLRVRRRDEQVEQDEQTEARHGGGGNGGRVAKSTGSVMRIVSRGCTSKMPPCSSKTATGLQAKMLSE